MTVEAEGTVRAPELRVALVGCPNTGKSSIFNHLTGLRTRTANYPGVTVTMESGRVVSGDASVVLDDLPGTYSLSPASPDEQVVLDHLHGSVRGIPAPDAVLVVIDATTLERSLVLAAEAMALGRPCAVVLTMVDELRSRGGDVDPAALSRALGVPVHEVVGHRGTGVPELRGALLAAGGWPTPALPPPTDDDDQLADWTESVTGACGYREPGASATTAGIDRVLLHPVWGVLVFFAVMFAFFQAIFTLAAPAMDAIDGGFSALGDLSAAHIGNPLLADFVGTALIGGVGGVLVFLPQIMLLFLLISLLESVGYMARAAFLMDRVMASSGLDGRAFVSMLSSVACAIPGIMSTRTMPSSRDRIATMMSAPLMTCSARLPVYVLLVGLLVPGDATWGPFGLQGLTMFLLYLAGGVSALLVARVFRATALRTGGLPFYLELPPYRLPTLRAVLLAVWGAAWAFLRKMATVILLITVLLWALMAFPTRTAETAGMDDAQASSYVLEHSYAATVGHAIEPVFEPLGFDWRVDIGLVGAMGAREVFVSTLGQVVAAQDPEDPTAALADLTYTSGEHAGERIFTAPTVVALMVFFIFAMQCVSTLVVMRRESNSLRWPVIAFVYMTALAWFAALAARAITTVVVS